MIYQQDWLMRQIQSMVQMIARMVFKKDFIAYDIHSEAGQKETDLLHIQLRVLLNDGLVNEAENLLFERLQTNHPDYLKVALDFYNRVNELTDSELEKANFTREEIKEGLVNVVKNYGFHLFDSKLFE